MINGRWLAVGAAVLGCLGSAPNRAPSQASAARVSQRSTAAEGRLIAADNSFGRSLFLQLRRQTPGGNLVLSPISVTLALEMTLNGAAGTTREAMAHALDLNQEGPVTLQEMNAGNRDLIATLEASDPRAQLSIANSLWLRNGAPFRADFIQRVRSAYHAEARRLDFRRPDAPAVMNHWVSQNTHGKIPQIIDSIDSDSILFLINATYFKASWMTPFNKASTQEQPFHLADGRTQQVPMMRLTQESGYLDNSICQGVRLPYADGQLVMDVYLPRPGVSQTRFYHALLEENGLGRWELNSRPGSLSLPRFKVEYGAALNGPLSALGMAIAFSGERANFSAMTSLPQVSISKVLHKTFLDVNEAGTEAAAATVVEMRGLAMPEPREPFTMVVDRPFFVVIRRRDDGVILFMGQIMKP